MNGAEHYADAERLIERAWHYVHGDGADPVVGAGFASMAQAHATLALAAAAALADVDFASRRDRSDWMRVTKSAAVAS